MAAPWAAAGPPQDVLVPNIQGWPGRCSGISDIGYMVKSLQQGLRAAVSRQLRALDLTMADFTALSVMSNAPGLSNAELAKLCFVTPQTMHQVVARLEERNLIRRQSGGTRKDGLKASLTPEGKRMLRRCMAINERVHATMLAGLTDADQERLGNLLQHCLDRLSRYH